MEASNGSGTVRNPNTGGSGVVPEVAERAFVDFCRAANPLGDMRRVVVAAEGANRYLSLDGVDAEALGRLFDIVGWPRAHNFVQTLRNAARSKFGLAGTHPRPGRPLHRYRFGPLHGPGGGKRKISTIHCKFAGRPALLPCRRVPGPLPLR